MIASPKGFRFDPFADARMGLSLFQMSDADWLVREPAQGIEAATAAETVELGSVHESPVPQGCAQTAPKGAI